MCIAAQTSEVSKTSEVSIAGGACKLQTLEILITVQTSEFFKNSEVSLKEK